MAFAYIIKDQHGLYFITFTVHQWVDVFTRKNYVDIILESIRYCQKEKGLLVYGWVVMSNHVHLLIRSNKENLSDIIRDFKKFTSGKIVKSIASMKRKAGNHGFYGYLKMGIRLYFGKRISWQRNNY